MSTISSLKDVDSKQKDIVSLFENINQPDLQKLVQNCGNNTDLSNIFAYVAAVSMSQQYGPSSSTNQTTTTNSPKKLVSSSNIHKNDKNLNISSAPVSSVNKFLGIVKQEPKPGTEAEHNENFSTISNAKEINDFWSNIIVNKNEPCFNTNESDKNDNVLLSSNLSTSNGLPKESDLIERKRPAAIQELLQMKKARLSHNLGTSTDRQILKINNDDKKELVNSNEFQQPLLNGAVLTNNTNNTNQIKEDDSETSSSSGSASVIENNYNLICSNLKAKNSKVDASMTTRAVVDLLVSLNGPSSKDASFQYLKTIQNYPGGSNVLNNNSPIKKTAKTSPNGTPNRLPQRTNDTDVCESPLSSLVPHNRIFAHVPGRLSLLSNVVKYKMTVGEVKRRLMGPESFNFSLLGALLRRAKMPEKSQMLVEELNQVGLSIPRGRRRLSQVTLLSALTESESIQFANDFQRVAEAEFPVGPLAELCVNRAINDNLYNKQIDIPMRKFQTIEQLNITLEMAKGFIQLLENDRSPVMDLNLDPIYERVIQDPLSTFSMLTHGFGTPALRVGVKIFVDFLERQLKYLK